MKKFIFLGLFTLALIMIFTSARTTVAKDSRVGTKAQNFTIGNDYNVITLNDYRGKYVILSCWSSADALSRLENMNYNRIVRNSNKLALISVNFDRSKALFKEVVISDSLAAQSQYFCEPQDRNEFNKKWQLANNYTTFLINPKGTIVAINPTTTDLKKLP